MPEFRRSLLHLHLGFQLLDIPVAPPAAELHLACVNGQSVVSAWCFIHSGLLKSPKTDSAATAASKIQTYSFLLNLNVLFAGS